MMKWLVNNKLFKINQDLILVNITIITLTKLKIDKQARNINIFGRTQQIKTTIQTIIIINRI